MIQAIESSSDLTSLQFEAVLVLSLQTGGGLGSKRFDSMLVDLLA
jgi:hypothetical protein